MSVFGIASNLINTVGRTLQSSTKQAQQEFQQLGQDLQSGDMSAAQSDLATLEQLVPQSGSSALAQTSSTISNAFNQLSQDLQAGNLSAAQKDYSSLQVNIQKPGAQTLGRRHSATFPSEPTQTTGIGYLTPQQTIGVIQQEWQQLHPTPASIGLGYLTPQETMSLIQGMMQRFQAEIQTNYGLNTNPTSSNNVSVLA
jgi:hypothetical protein